MKENQGVVPARRGGGVGEGKTITRQRGSGWQGWREDGLDGDAE